MPISFGTNTTDLARWIYIPDEVIDFEPYLHVSVLGIMSSHVDEVTIPSLKLFTNVSMITIDNGVAAVTEYPDNLKSLWMCCTHITTLSNIPDTVTSMSLTQNKRLSIDKIPANLVSLAGYGQHFDDIIITPILSKLSLFRCSFSRILGLDVNTLTNMEVFYLMSCTSPYPEYVTLNGSPIGDFGSISIVEYSNTVQNINRGLYISRCIPFAELHDKCLSYHPSPNKEIPNSIHVMRLGSNYARRIAEFLG
jgi:hypothetical protein